jgi:hypothetical protein
MQWCSPIYDSVMSLLTKKESQNPWLLMLNSRQYQ